VGLGTVRTMPGSFVTATAVTLLDPDRQPDVATSGPPVRFAAEVQPGWDIGGNANGGYLMAIAGRAMAEATGRPPVTLTAHFLRPAAAGPCVVDVTVVRTGRRFATATAALSMDGHEVIRLLGTFGVQTPGGPSWIREQPVDLPPYDECELPPDPTYGPKPAMMDRLAVRIRPGDEGFRTGRPTGDAEIRGWFAFAEPAPSDPIAASIGAAPIDAAPIDAIGLLLVADAFPPPIFNTEIPIAWVPTVELTVHIRGVPVPGPLRCAFRSRFIHGGLIDEEGEIWDSAGTLVAQCRQLSLAARPG
jgi:acyl-CoA thioesterase